MNALIITIPYSISMSMGPATFDAIKNIAATCGDVSTFQYDFIYKRLRTPLIIVTYCSVGCLVTTLLFYIQRPKKDAEQLVIDKWWKRGVSTNNYCFYSYVNRIHTIIGSICILLHAVFHCISDCSFVKYI